MRAVEAPAPPPPAPLLAGTPLGILAILAAVVVITEALARGGLVPAPASRIAAIAALHGALLATALAWTAPAGHDRREDRGRPHGEQAARVGATRLRAVARATGGCSGRPAVWVTGIGCATVIALAEAGPPGLFLLTPAWLAWVAWRRVAPGLGLTLPRSRAAVLAGLAIGVGLGAHLVLAASETLGYRLRADGVGPWAAAVAYDVGANVPSAELFFRGALFDRAHRRWSFAAAAALSGAACVVRYLADPLLPRSVEVVVGAAFYMAVLATANAWLRWWSGSLLPGALSALGFFAAYRLIALP